MRALLRLGVTALRAGGLALATAQGLGAGAAWIFAAGCFYVSDDDVEAVADKDGDGWWFDEDCNDKHPDVYPGAGDVRGDGCDADCGALNNDIDGDDWPNDVDCAPDDPDVYPCNPADEPGDQRDQDCDGHDEPRPEGDCDKFTGDPNNPDAAPIPEGAECLTADAIGE